MGFGILFAGYMFLFSIPLHTMGVCAEIIGYILMIRALFLLKEYVRDFGNAMIATVCLLPFGLYSLVLQCFKWFGADTLYAKIITAAELPYSILLSIGLLIFHHFLLSAVQKQAADVDLADIVLQTRRNRIVTFCYFVLSIMVNFVNIPIVTNVIPYSTIVGFVSLFGFAWMLLNAKMIFNCYMWICLPEDLDMPMRDSKIPSIFRKAAPKEPDVEAEYQRQKAAYNEAMRQRQIARTKKNKRRKK